MTKPKARKFLSVKERIERTPKIASKEMGWYRRKGNRRLMKVADQRDSISLTRSDIPKDASSFIHTHIIHTKTTIRECILSAFSLPSVKDLHKFLHDIRESNIRFWHIVSIDRKRGKIRGYLSLYASKKLVNSLKLNAFRFRSDIDRYSYSEMSLAFIKQLKQFGLKVSIKPMPGFKFDGKRFVKK